MKLSNIINHFKLIILINLLVLPSIAIFIFTTSIGAELLLSTIISLKNNLPIKIKINQISGSLHKTINLKNITITNEKSNLLINNANITINWLELLKHQNISLNINDISGNVNNYPLSAKINLLFNYKKQYLFLNDQNFIKIGDNNLYLTQEPAAKIIRFNISANQMNIFDNLFNNIPLAGKLIINGNIANDLSKLTANIKTENLKINNIELDPILQNKDNSLNIILTKTALEAKINFQQISHIMKFIPNITRLKGKLQGTIKIDTKKNITSDLALKDITMSLPEYGIKIKPLTINFTANNSKIISIAGKGVMRHGPGEFNLKGYFNPTTHHLDNHLEISGNNIECINTPGYHLITSLNLQLKFLTAQNALQISGNINIPNGTINLDKQQSSSIIKSTDIMLLSNNIKTDLYNNTNIFKLLPNIELRIEPNTKLLGKGLDALISGKLKIYTENEQILANGRISIKKGIYKLSGQEFTIEKGRIIYLPGTLINNPSLDIKIFPKQNNQLEEQYLYLEGTLDNPIIKDSGLINEHQAVLQLLNFGSNKLTSSIKETLNLQEFGIQEDHYISNQFKYKPLDESVLHNKYFVIGKQINKQLHLQYLKTLNTVDNTVRIKYKLSPHIYFGIESSTEAGNGADLGFALEK